MWLIDAVAILMPVMQATNDSGMNWYFDGRAFQDYLASWLIVNAVKE